MKRIDFIILVSFAYFQILLENDTFVDYLNKFCSLPIFGQRVIYQKNSGTCLTEPRIPADVDRAQILRWIWEHRFPFLYRSPVYAEYQVKPKVAQNFGCFKPPYKIVKFGKNSQFCVKIQVGHKSKFGLEIKILVKNEILVKK